MAERTKETRRAVMFSRRMYLQIRTVYCKDIVSLKRRALVFYMLCQFSCDLQPVRQEAADLVQTKGRCMVSCHLEATADFEKGSVY